jgi:hypothetical protein
MGNQSHTPGPWRVEWVRNSTYIKADGTDRDLSVCRVMQHRNSNNVNILLYAPDMLEALKKIGNARFSNLDMTSKDYADNLIKTIDEAIDVICKASGV